MNSNTKQIDISFIIPCYNASSSLENTVHSLAKQNSQLLDNGKIEIILIDDCSQDDCKTRKIINELKQNFSYIKTIFLDKNYGQAVARNKGIEKALGKYIGFLDADDTASNNFLEKITPYIHQDFDVITWGLFEEHYGNSNKVLKSYKVVPKEGIYTTHQTIINKMIELEELTLLGYLWNKLYKKEIIEKFQIKLPNEHLIEDELFNIEVFKYINSLICISEPLYHYKRIDINGNTVTSSYLPDYFSQYKKRIIILYEYLKKENSFSCKAKNVLANEYTRFSMSAIWRNTQKESKMTITTQRKWIENWYEKDLTKKLIQYTMPKGKLAKIYTSCLKKKQTSMVLLIAKIINFSSKYLKNTLIRARKSR